MKNCPICSSSNTKIIAELHKRPDGETPFAIPEDQYFRAFYHCENCHIYFAEHNYDFDELYRGQYNASTYANKITKTYEKIMNLPEGTSDNQLRCARVDAKLNSLNRPAEKTRILDVGSGLSVFLGRMKSLGYPGVAIDPDPISIQHAIEYIGLEGGFCGNVEDYNPNLPFQVLSMNKVLEHVRDPLKLLKDGLQHLETGGLCYLELPDGKNALAHAKLEEREEFFIEHYYAYSLLSMKKLMKDAGLVDLEVVEIHEPSDKYSLYAFGTKS